MNSKPTAEELAEALRDYLSFATPGESSQLLFWEAHCNAKEILKRHYGSTTT